MTTMEFTDVKAKIVDAEARIKAYEARLEAIAEQRVVNEGDLDALARIGKEAAEVRAKLAEATDDVAALKRIRARFNEDQAEQESLVRRKRSEYRQIVSEHGDLYKPWQATDDEFLAWMREGIALCLKRKEYERRGKAKITRMRDLHSYLPLDKRGDPPAIPVDDILDAPLSRHYKPRDVLQKMLSGGDLSDIARQLKIKVNVK